jgi:S-adenosyl methyltransferase
MSEKSDLPMEIDTSKPHTARIYDYYLGGKNHFAADRETAAKLAIDWPSVNVAAREQRKFLGRAVRYLADEAGIRQFLDIGTGLPTTNNVHDVAQAVNPSCRVVYVDNDPLVLTHARALLTSTPEGRTAYIHADLRDPGAILSHQSAREVLDFTRPTALMLVGILHFIPDADKPAEIIATLVDALPSGSYLVATHITAEHDPERVGASERTSRSAGVSAQFRDSSDFARFAFSGLRLVPPGVVSLPEWRPPAGGMFPPAAEVSVYGGVARKP